MFSAVHFFAFFLVALFFQELIIPLAAFTGFTRFALDMYFGAVAPFLSALHYGAVPPFLSALHYGAILLEYTFYVLVLLAFSVAVLFAFIDYDLPWLPIACFAWLIDGLAARAQLILSWTFGAPSCGMRPCLRLASLLFDNIPERVHLDGIARQAEALRRRQFGDITNLRKEILDLVKERERLVQQLRELGYLQALPALQPVSSSRLPTYHLLLEKYDMEAGESAFRRFYLHRYDYKLKLLRSSIRSHEIANAHDKSTLERLLSLKSRVTDETACLKDLVGQQAIVVDRQQRKPPTPRVNAKETERRRERDPIERALRTYRVRGYERAAQQAAQQRSARYQPIRADVAAAVQAELASFSTSGQSGVAAMPLPSSPANYLVLLPQQVDLAAIPAAAQAEERPDVEMIDVHDDNSDVDMADVNDEEMPTEQMALVIAPVLAPSDFQGAPVQLLDMDMDLDEREIVPEASIAYTTTTTTDHGLQMVQFSSDTSIMTTVAASDPSVEVPTSAAGSTAQTVAASVASVASTVQQSEPAVPSMVSQMPSGPSVLPSASAPVPATSSDEEEAAAPANPGNGIWYFDTSRTPLPAPATSAAPPSSPSSAGGSQPSSESEQPDGEEPEPAEPEESDDESTDESDDDSGEQGPGNLGQPVSAEVQPPAPTAAPTVAAPSQPPTEVEEVEELTSDELQLVATRLKNMGNNYLLFASRDEQATERWREEAQDAWESRSDWLRLGEEPIMLGIQVVKDDFLVPWLDDCLGPFLGGQPWTRAMAVQLREDLIDAAWGDWHIRLDDLAEIPADD
ncbi:hypothetical protein V8F20_005685 [Naviculisporaceae sp. PSN 640]